MAAAMQRIAELEATTQRGHLSGARPNSNDDTRAVIRDNKFRRTPRMSPHTSSRSPGADPYLYSSTDAAAAAASGDNVKLRTRQVRSVVLARDSLGKLQVVLLLQCYALFKRYIEKGCRSQRVHSKVGWCHTHPAPCHVLITLLLLWYTVGAG